MREETMVVSRRLVLRLMAGSTAGFLPFSRLALALDYPTRPVRVIVGLPSGTAPDVFARLVGSQLSRRLGQPFVVENRPGAATNLGTEAVARATPDGYTLLVIIPTNAINAVLYTKANFDFIQDITPVALIGGTPLVMVMNPQLPAKNLPEFIGYAKANPGKINMASLGVGSLVHLCGEMFQKMAGVEFTHVPYHGAVMPDLLAGQVHLYFTTMPEAGEYVRDGRLRALGVTTVTPSAVLPDVPTIAKFVPGYEVNGWIGFGAPKGTPASIIDLLNMQINSAAADSVLKSRLAALDVKTAAMTPIEFGRFIGAEIEKWRKVIEFANIKV